MKLDEALRNAKRLDAPETLGARVMSRVRADLAYQSSLTANLRRLAARRGFKAAMGAAACAAAILTAVNIAGYRAHTEVAQRESAVQQLAYNEMDLFLEQTLGRVYQFKSTGISAEYQVEEDVGNFINNQINRIYLINGGNNA